MQEECTTEQLIMDKVEQSINKRFEIMQVNLMKTINETLSQSDERLPTYASTLRSNSIGIIN